MGVRGLQSFMEKNGMCYEVDVRTEVARYRQSNQRPPVIVFDVHGCFKRIYAGLPWILNGQMKEHEERVRFFVQQFFDIGARLVFYEDGSVCPIKLDVWKKRRYDRSEVIESIIHRLSSGESLNDVESNLQSSLPCGLSWLTSVIVMFSVGECDGEIAQYSREHQCLAIFGQDSDFVIYDCGRYWSMNHFDVNKMTTLAYDRNKLADVLRIPRENLPLFASLMGNDIVSFESLRDFHSRVRNDRRGWIAWFVSEYVRNRGSDGSKCVIERRLREIAVDVFKDESKWTLLKDSLESYRVDRELIDPNLTVCREDENWERILRTALRVHRAGIQHSLFNVIFKRSFFSSNTLEDYRMNDLPTSRKCFLKLRQVIYGILLHEFPGPRPILVKELIFEGPGSIDDFTLVPPIPPSEAHPGILALWNYKDKSLMAIRWNLLCSSVGLDVRLIYPVPMEYRVLLLALKYLLSQNIHLEPWEINAVILTALFLPQYTASDLRDLVVQSVNVRCARLYSLVTKAFSFIRFLNFSCGSPIDEEGKVPTHYQDGKLFHCTYLRARQACFDRNMTFGLTGLTKYHYNILAKTLFSQERTSRQVSVP